MERITNMAVRLKEYRELNNLTLADMETRSGIPAQTINRYELGQRAPKIDIAVCLAESLHINPLWLQGYNVPMEINDAAQEPLGGKSERANLIYDRLSRLSPENLEIALAQLDVLLSHQEKRDTE